MYKTFIFSALTLVGIIACSSAVETFPPALGRQEVSPLPTHRFSQTDMLASLGRSVKGSVQRAVPGRIDLPQPLSEARLGTLLPTGAKTAELDFVAFGSSLTAGFRDMGLHRAGQLTAYPNLVARQIGLTNFQTPAFSPEQGNGTGFVQFTGTAQQPQWTLVDNNLASLKADYFEFPKYTGKVDNYAIPYDGRGVFFGDFSKMAANGVDPSPWPRSVFHNRLVPAGQERLLNTQDLVTKRPVHLFTMELGFDGFLQQFMNPVTIIADGLPVPDAAYTAFLFAMKKKQSRGVILLMPGQILDFPYFRLVSVDALKQKLGVSKLYGSRAHSSYTVEITSGGRLLPTPNILSLLNGEATGKTEITLPDEDVIDDSEAGLSINVRALNQVIRQTAAMFDTPVVDLEKVYGQILKGAYITEDGYRIDPSFPGGNFFSQDGIYPSAIGQAVIANEVIKVLNQSYQSQIPLINVGDYARLNK